MYYYFLMDLSKDRILITGGCGYIGSHTSLLLLEIGYSIIIVDSNVNSSAKIIDKINQITLDKSIDIKEKLTFYKGDIRDYSFLNNIFENEKANGNDISFVIHFAGLKSVSISRKKPLEYWDVNIGGTITLLKVMKNFGCKSIIFSSSATVYQSTNNSLLTEKDKLNPINPYGHTKEAIEKFLKDIFDSSETNYKIASLRYFNPIGAHFSGLIGENPVGSPNNIFPTICKVAAGQQSFLEVFGNDWDTEDGTCIRDYVHVMDVALGHIKTLEFLLRNNNQYLIMNLGTGKGTSVLELINKFQNVNNIEIPYKFTSRRKGDTGNVIADNTLLFETLGWKPTRNIEEMCEEGWRWKINYPHGF